MGFLRLLLASSVIFSASTALARADIEVSFAAPANLDVYATGRFEATVANIGNKNADGVMLYIQLPETHTSPTVHILGTLGAFSGACALQSATILACDLGRVNKSSAKSIFFDLALPAQAGGFDFIAEARTTTRESTTANNAVAETVTPIYVDTPIVGPAPATNRHCTGTNLTAFFECTLYPSSISSHQITFNADHTISFANAPASFTGEWSQGIPSRLTFVYRDNGTIVAAFQGYGVGGGCFEGLTVFPGSQWVSPYQVCLD